MLNRARLAAPFVILARGRAEQLPWSTVRFDRLFCINALHHFSDPDAFLRDAGLRRITTEQPVLRAGLRLFATTGVLGPLPAG